MRRRLVVYVTSGTFDTFSFLYSMFNPASPLSGGIAGNDDLPKGAFGTSGFAATLAANTTYRLVVTGY